MARNAYLATGRLASHPAFRWGIAALVCTCGEVFTRVAEYDRCFLSHDPDARTAWYRLSGRTYERVAAKRGWPTPDEGLAMWPDSEE